MSSNPGSRDPYFCTFKGTDINRETYWRIKTPGQPDYYFRFVEIQDSAGGLYAQIQDEVGYKGVHTGMFDQAEVEEVTDPEEIALAMLAIHG